MPEVVRIGDKRADEKMEELVYLLDRVSEDRRVLKEALENVDREIMNTFPKLKNSLIECLEEIEINILNEKYTQYDTMRIIEVLGKHNNDLLIFVGFDPKEIYK